MNDLEQQEQHNAAYMEAALSWLRLLLMQHAGLVGRAATVVLPSDEAEGGSVEGRADESTVAAEPAGGSLTVLTGAVSEERVAQAAETMAARAAASPAPALIELSERLGLSRFEQDVLLLCAAMELDTRIASLCARVQDDPTRSSPTFALAFVIFDEPSWDALTPQRPLRRWRLLEISQPGALPLTVSPLRADERIVAYIQGLNHLDDRLAAYLTPLLDAEADADLPESQRAMVDGIVQHVRWEAGEQRPAVIQLLGNDAPSKQLVAAHAAAQLGRRVYRLAAALLPQQQGELDALARLWQRECRLLPLALYLDASDPPPDGAAGAQPMVGRFVSRVDGLTFLDTREQMAGLDDLGLVVHVGRPTAREQQAAWQRALGAHGDDLPALLAGQFDLDDRSIRRIGGERRGGPGNKAADAEPNGHAPDDQRVRDDVWDACLDATRPRLNSLAQRLDVKATWDMLVLPGDETALLRQVADQVRHRAAVYQEWGFADAMSRGLGISVLFAGESGTGKTMAAEVLANELRLDLYRIDLSAVVSKYIGETEKNLRRLFDAAESGGAILFFDEADALFGKRSEVKDSHDRYANIEINYLLQRLENYRGLAILATNMKSALDPAFMRRLRFIVTFPFPGPAQRALIWRKVFPPRAKTKALEYDRFARFNLTGGSIRNIAMNAAFLAVAAEDHVTTELVLQAVRTELRKLDRPINEGDFR